MKSINRSLSFKLVAVLSAATFLALASQSAMAAGTASGTVISNGASLSFTVGGATQTVASTVATFWVDNKVNVTVAKVADASTIAPNSTNQVLAFTVTNNGNTSQRYALTTTTTGSPTVTMGNVRIYRDNGSVAGAWDATDTLYVDASTFGNLAADSSLNVLIVADTPIAATNGQTAVFNLVATTVNSGTLVVTTNPVAADTPLSVDVVFADLLGTATGDVANDGKHSVSATYTVAASLLAISKTARVLCDPVNGNTNPKNIPGAAVQYAITITNAAGAASATLTQVTDTLVAQLGFDPKLINGTGTPAATTCTSAGGTQLSPSTGFSAVRGTGIVTSYAAPGAASQATTAGATVSSGTVTIDFATLAGTAYGGVNAVLPANSFVTVYYNAFVQ
jgi:hypothetical protein